MAKLRKAHCGKCGALKIVLKSGALRCTVCHNMWGRNYYRTSSLRRTKQRQSYVLRKYGVTMSALDEMLVRQDGRCAICGKRWHECTTAKRSIGDDAFLRFLYVDHDHRTGKVRGILCNACNTAIGLFEEDPLRLITALRYLETKPGLG
jgi:hypothetical protein